MKTAFKEGQSVYVRRGNYLEAATVDHTYTSCTGVECVSFTSGPNTQAINVITYDQYWANQRNALEGVE